MPKQGQMRLGTSSTPIRKLSWAYGRLHIVDNSIVRRNLEKIGQCANGGNWPFRLAKMRALAQFTQGRFTHISESRGRGRQMYRS